MSRDISKFEKPEIAEEFKKKCLAAGFNVVFISVDRDYKEQAAYFAQGREELQDVNLLRHVAGLTPITLEENARKVTWTMHSEHIVNLDDQLTDNDKARAFDFGIIKGGKYVKGDNTAELQMYKTCAKIGEALGLYSGGRFKNQDWPHLQLKPIV